jgi:hypothetical protein
MGKGLIQTEWRAWRLVLLLGGMLVLASCQNQGSSAEQERRDGFYGGISGGFSRP